MHFFNLILPLVAAIGTLHSFAAPAHGHHNHLHLRSAKTNTRTRTVLRPSATSSAIELAATNIKTRSSRTRTKITTTTAKTTTATKGTTTTTSTTSSSPGVCSTSGPAETLSVSQTKPASAVQVPGNFIGFGFETAFLNDYSGTFSQNLVNSIASRLGETVIIRIGGTSGDRLLYDPKQTAAINCISGDCPVGSSATYILGPSYFNGFKSFPKQHFTVQAPLGSTLNLTNSLDYVTLAYQAAGASRVDAIAIGNEPDTYGNGYSVVDYTQAAVDLENQIITKLKLPKERIFEILDTASGEPSGNFTVEEAFQDGIDNKGVTKYVAQHWYQSPTNLASYGAAELQTYLMNHSAITSKYEQGYLQTLQYVQANQPQVEYIISESGSSLAGPPKDYQDAFGACLWAVDFNLYSMSIGVARLDGTQRPAAPHSLWVPDTSANSASLGSEQNIGPQVRGPYYATPMLADFLGTSSGAVVELLGEDTLTAYALYDSTSGALSKVALVNLNYWSADTGGTRSNTTFNLPVSKGVTQVTVKRLHADGGAHAQGYDVQGTSGIITWAGETWSYQLDNGAGSQVQGVATQEVIAVCNGVASIVVPESEAVVVYVSGGS